MLIVDASKEFKTGRAQNELLPEHVERIHAWFRDYTDVEGITRVVTLDEIAANGHNLNIPRYVEPKVHRKVDQVFIMIGEYCFLVGVTVTTIVVLPFSRLVHTCSSSSAKSSSSSAAS